MSGTPEPAPGPASSADRRAGRRRRVVLVAGSGRSGTSTFAGALKHLGLHVPQPEVAADETNPRGFGEPRWVVDFHNRLLNRGFVQVTDARPRAWADTATLGMRDQVRDTLTDWLSAQFEDTDEIVVKDPRLSWFLELWRVAAQRCDVTPCLATVLRPPTEVVRSRKEAYGDRIGDVSAMAAWVNMMLHTERATRGSTRVFIRYHDLLGDCTATMLHAGRALGLETVQNAPPGSLAAVQSFIDPSLRTVQTTWDDIVGPESLRALTRETWYQLDRLPDIGDSDGASDGAGDGAEVRAALDRLHEEYLGLYADAEAVSTSTATAAARRATSRARRAARKDRPDSTDRMHAPDAAGVLAGMGARVRRMLRG